ncbi:hypothetical protein BDB00DRAFT_786524 [Zychaea mexicana]|uniref:uncharacterized protein n=1 Tax=Zychaea mexicana TaxID=64656 RepID=UPI0022FE9462|nr:uncharacterized protein BDB00DRAFT_786524 [Zychaea mexicana]KAI9495176.1 hypothetical protein BDB00DRAFT_786524 [Zychaea mexicana]
MVAPDCQVILKGSAIYNVSRDQLVERIVTTGLRRIVKVAQADPRPQNHKKQQPNNYPRCSHHMLHHLPRKLILIANKQKDCSKKDWFCLSKRWKRKENIYL